MEAETIRCEQHGQRQATFVCQHLLTGSAKGWIAIESGDAGGPDAICAECDTAWRAAGDEFTDAIRSETKFASGWCAPGATTNCAHEILRCNPARCSSKGRNSSKPQLCLNGSRSTTATCSTRGRAR